MPVCRQAAILIASTANMTYSVMVEARLDVFPGPDSGLRRLIRDGAASPWAVEALSADLNVSVLRYTYDYS